MCDVECFLILQKQFATDDQITDLEACAFSSVDRNMQVGCQTCCDAFFMG